jgi:hypothetical protein
MRPGDHAGDIATKDVTSRQCTEESRVDRRLFDDDPVSLSGRLQETFVLGHRSAVGSFPLGAMSQAQL